MKTKYMILGLAMCGCIACVGLKARAADKAKASDPKEVEQIKSLDSLTAPGAAAVDSAKIAEIEALFKAKSANVRAHAAMALGSIGPAAKDSTPALAELLKDPDAIVRRTALRAIRKIHPGPKMMVPLCVKMIEAADPAMRARILNAIAEGGADAVPGLMEALKNEKAAFWALIVLRDIGPAAKDAVPAIAEKLKDKRPDIRREAVLTLGAMGNAAETAVPQLVELLNDKDAATAATFVLGKMGQIPKDAEATIRSNAKSNNEMLSTTSLWALTRVHPDDKELRRDTAEKLVERLKDKDPFARVAAARALAALPPAPEIMAPIWEKALKDADETTIRHAMDALAELGAPAVPRLIDALKYEKFRAAIIYTLGRMGPAASPATEELAKLVDDKDSRVAHEAIITLGDIGPGAKNAVPALTHALEQADDRNMNFGAVEFALGKIGPEAASAESALLQRLDSKDDNVRLLSAWALSQIDPTGADVAAKAVPVLTAGLACPMPEDRVLAADALGDFGPLAKSAAEALKKAATDESKDVQEESAKALKSVERPAPASAAPAVAKPAPTPTPDTAMQPRPGDFVVTVDDKVEVGVKGVPGEFVPKGTKLKVLEIRGAWIGVRVDGTDKTGWVLGEQISKP